jgi:hypothetical protein
VASIVVLAGGCSSKDWNDPEYLAERLKAGDPEAFRIVQRLESPEEKIAAIPALVDAYNAGIHEDTLRILMISATPAGCRPLLTPSAKKIPSPPGWAPAASLPPGPASTLWPWPNDWVACAIPNIMSPFSTP